LSDVFLYTCGDEILCVIEEGVESDVENAHGDCEIEIGNAWISCGVMGSGSEVYAEQSLI
jgi:hypothetical protein